MKEHKSNLISQGLLINKTQLLGSIFIWTQLALILMQITMIIQYA